LLAVNEALERLAAFDPRQARIVELRFFVGLSTEEVSEVLGVSSRTVKRDLEHCPRLAPWRTRQRRRSLGPIAPAPQTGRLRRRRYLPRGRIAPQNPLNDLTAHRAELPSTTCILHLPSSMWKTP